MQALRSFLRRIPFWGWVAVTACAVLILISLPWLVVKKNLKPILLSLSGMTGQRFNMQTAAWKDGGFIELVNLDFGDIARIEKLDIRISPLNLLRGNIDEIRIHGGRVWLSKLAGNSDTPGTKKEGGLPFAISIHKLVISNTTLYLDNLGGGIPTIPLTLAETPPALVFNDLHFGGSTNNSAGKAMQTAVIENFVIYSPYDPAARVLSFDKIRLEFSLEGLEKHRIEKLVFETPIIYVGPDLFWFTDEISKKKSSQPETPTIPWQIGEFQLRDGRIMISAHGQPAFPLPGVIEVDPTPLTLGDFSQLHLAPKFSSHIKERSYPEYNLKFKNLQGDLAFNLPLGTKNDRANLVRQFTVEEVEWKGLKFGKKGSPAWVVLTFDEKGVYCKLGSPVAKGYINASVDIFLDQGMRWIATANTTGVDVANITELLSPDDFVMTGKVNASFRVNGQSREILGLGGFARLTEKGTLHINAIRDMKENLPAEWPQIKRDLALIPMKAFERYDYTYGDLEFTYAPPTSFIRLNLDGLQGKRNFEIHWKDERSKANSLIIPENSSVLKITSTTSTHPEPVK